MKNRTIALILIPTLLLSSISLALSLSSRFTPEAQEHSSIPPEAFTHLGSKKGVGFGDWDLSSLSDTIIIFSYPAGAAAGGWDNYLVDMLITITVTVEGGAANNGVDITFKYLAGTQTINLISTGSNSAQSTTFTEQIYEVTLTLVGTIAGGHYFVSADRRV